MLDRAGLEGQTETSDPITCPSMAGGQSMAQMHGRLAASFSPLLNVFYGNVFASLKNTHTSSVCTHAHTHREFLHTAGLQQPSPRASGPPFWLHPPLLVRPQPKRNVPRRSARPPFPPTPLCPLPPNTHTTHRKAS